MPLLEPDPTGTNSVVVAGDLQVQQRLELLRQQERKMGLGQHLDKLKQKQLMLHNEVQQLTTTLTSSKQANVLAHAQVTAAVGSTESELQAGQASSGSLYTA